MLGDKEHENKGSPWVVMLGSRPIIHRLFMHLAELCGEGVPSAAKAFAAAQQSCHAVAIKTN